MDDLIYVIALIAWVAFSFYRKSQKKANATQGSAPRPQTRRETGALPTLEEILLGRQPEPEPVTATVWDEGTSPELSETSFEREYNLRGITSIEELDKPMNVTKPKPKETPESEEETDAYDIKGSMVHIDLRQAVIYSEILNRPYV
jgi:hypothetical protein